MQHSANNAGDSRDVSPEKKAEIVLSGSQSEFLPGAPAELRETLREYQGFRYAPNTKRAYMKDWSTFEDWCRTYKVNPYDASGVQIASFLIDMAAGTTFGRSKKPSTVERHLATISTYYRRAKKASPWDDDQVQEALITIRKKHGVLQNKKKALVSDDVRNVLKKIPNSVRGARDRTLLLMGFSGAFRRSELVALNVEHLTFESEGVLVFVERSKTDQAGAGRTIGIRRQSDKEICPVKALEDWIREGKIETGPLFRRIYGEVVKEERLSDDSYVRVIKESVENVGLDPDLYAGHSLRSGFATTAEGLGWGVKEIMDRTGHRAAQTAIGYMQRRDVYGPKDKNIWGGNSGNT